MEKVNIFSVFLLNPFRRPRLSTSKKYLLFLFMTMAILLCYGFFFTTQVYALEEVIAPTEVLEVPEVPATITTEEVVSLTEISEVSATITTEEVVIPTEISSDIEIDTTWTKEGSPYIVTNSILVKKGATLNIEPGVVVKFSYGVSLIVNGSLDAEGTAEEPIYFTSAKDDTLGGDTNNDGGATTPSKGDWDVVIIIPENDPPLDDSELASSTINNVTFNYSDRGLIVFDKEVTSVGLYVNSQILLFHSQSTFSKLSTFKIDLFEASTVTIDNNSLLSSAGGSAAVYVFDASKLDITHSSIHGCSGCSSTVLVFDGSTLSLDNVEISTDDKESYTSAIEIFDDKTVLKMTGSTEAGAYEGIMIDTDARAIIEGSTFECINSCINGYGGYLSLTNSKISGAKDFGIYSTDSPRTTYENCREVYSEEDDEYTEVCDEIVTTSLFELNNNEIFGNGTGIAGYGGKIIGKNNNIHDNTVGAFNLSEEDGGSTVDLKSNFWGDKTGPKNETSNPTGLGNEASENILFTPWLKYDPLKPGVSNILFIPGFQSSRLYKETGDIEDGTGYEKKLWEPGVLSNASEIFMDENGESIDKNIYTRDVMSTATVFGLGVLNIYKSFFEKLDNMVANGEISNWKVVPYDWRFSPLDIVRRGEEKDNGNISYTEELSDGQVPYIIDQLQKLADSSNNGKVTIVTHSNGGLVAKALIARLMEMKANGESDLIDKIDNLVAVAPPLVGTPKAMLGILHGYDQGIFGNMLLTRKDARDLGLTIPGAFGLLPSEKYISGVNNDLILLDPSLSKINNWISKYGESIDTYDELRNFLQDLDGVREDPGHNDLVNPVILNKTIFNKAKLLHDTIDNLVFPSSIKVYQVAGWGLPTADDIRYKTKNECASFIKLFCKKKKVVLSADAGFTSGGDATVVSGSALFGDGEEYYLNLSGYNIYNKKITDHTSIFEVPYLYDFVHNILKSDSSLPSYITKLAPSPVEYTVIKMRSPVAIDIYDEYGFHTGVVEGIDGSSDTIEEGIPNSLYMEIGDNKYIVVPKDGKYKLELTGLSDGIFTLEQEQLVNDLPGESVVWKDIPTTALFLGEVTIEGGELATSIAMDENGDGEFESNLSPVDNSLKEDDIIERHSISGSYMVINREILPQNVVPDSENIEIPTIIKEIKDESLNNKVISKMIAIKTTKEIAVPEAEGNTLTASAGTVYSQNPIRFKWQLIIIGSFFLLLGGLKFIFKLI